MEIRQGQNAPLAAGGEADILITWDKAPGELDIACFMVTGDGKVLSDDYMIFYNQLVSPSGAVRFNPVSSRPEFSLNLNTMPGEIKKCVFTATIDGPGVFRDVAGLVLTAKIPGGKVAYKVEGAAEEKAVIIAELYLHTSGWKIRAVGRGFNGGLAPLAEHFGVTVDREDTTTSQPPASPKAPVKPEPKQDKPVNLTKIDLLKKKVTVVLEKKQIKQEKARAAAVIDASGSMAALYSKGVVQRTVERALAVAACMSENGVMDMWFYASKFKRTPSVTEKDYEGYVQRTYPRPRFFGGVGIGNNEPRVMRDVINRYTKEAPSSRLPAYIMFFTDGGIYLDKEIEKILIESSKLPIFWQFIGIGKENYGILRKLDTMPGRFIDNANFFALDDLDDISDEELYNRLLNEFPSWLKEARAKNVL